MPSKVKITKKQKKSKRSVSTACWAQNQDGSLSLTIGSKKPDSDEKLSETSPQSCKQLNIDDLSHLERDGKKDAHPTWPSVDNRTTNNNLPIKILKSNQPQDQINFRERQKLQRRMEMTTE